MLNRLPVTPFLEQDGPLLDVRSPAEFAQGHVIGAVNVPLFNDAERAAVGTTYKQVGRQRAVHLGLQLVGPRLTELADALLAQAAPSEPGTPLRLLCWRGGMRSASVAWLAGTLDLPVLLLEGGYKAYRRWVLERFEQSWPLRLLGGRTGSGKTELLLALAALGVAVVDLEGLAQHRGSSFGGLGQAPQPSSEQFENLLANELQRHSGAREIWLEAESSQVGRCRIPAALWQHMGMAPVVAIERPMENRLQRLVLDYGCQSPQGLEQATVRISKRLGPQRTAAALEALAAQDWAGACRQMLDYYDRCYDHDLARQRPSDAGSVRRVELGHLSAAESAAHLVQEGWVRTAA
ncbi:tRNA 2-selenouridine(34) synthase MnmH [Cyanobium sp. Morenito 9A2]|uniref:tRNA 2-selenouridine(34) synthase MnmH n=1 Tax=Cyanobium sp. Morenito 9A2 TaxID=2823718 RepID=UPI0020CD35C6|nr:tRNA 2-selenouridine(34) synthase MnmH [Cyanobium sp. Morenito 9A2]MCP9850502.1 tRNA 2-selenouridine(34) synthase MnmH [Cyanobium sp. Morenito 9A2]